MNEDKEIKKAISDIVDVSKKLSRFKKYDQNGKSAWLNKISENILSSRRSQLVIKHAEKGRSFLGSLKRYPQNPKNYLSYVVPHTWAIENYVKEHPKFAKNYGWNTPLVAQRYRIPGSERFIGINDVIGKNEESNTDVQSVRENEKSNPDVQSWSAPPIKPPNVPPSVPPSPPPDDNDNDNKPPKKWGVYKHNFTDILKGVDKSDLYKNKKQDSKRLSAEKENTKGVNENTKALTGLRAFLGPYAKLAMPFYAAKMLYQTGAASTDAALERVQRRTFGGLYGASRDRRGYRRMFDAMTSYGASEKDVMREYAGQKKWASTLMFGMGLDKIEALAMVLGKAPGPAEMRDPELMQRWLRKNMRGITDMQAMQLSAMGVASDAFIESARKGQAVDIEGRTATARETYDVLGKQTGNPLKKLGYKVAADQAYAIEAASSGNAGKAFSIAALGSNYRLYDQAVESEMAREKRHDESIELIPRQTSVTVNINGNIDSEERANYFAEQIGAEVSNAEK